MRVTSHRGRVPTHSLQEFSDTGPVAWYDRWGIGIRKPLRTREAMSLNSSLAPRDPILSGSLAGYIGGSSAASTNAVSRYSVSDLNLPSAISKT
jgi:hypothetical protein